eukprot:GHVN01075506.1.p1 GENE.GHVN01075506.1~~GHVN01075506.1.p1  ORF type:complete len:221 (+),score=29.11 GHVN01075506.1:2200-2862(+)
MTPAEPKVSSRRKPGRSQSQDLPQVGADNQPPPTQLEDGLDVGLLARVVEHLEQQQAQINLLQEALSQVHETFNASTYPSFDLNRDAVISSPQTTQPDPTAYLTQIFIAQQRLQVDAASITAAWATLWVLNTRSPMTIGKWIKLARSITERVTSHVSPMSVSTQLSVNSKKMDKRVSIREKSPDPSETQSTPRSPQIASPSASRRNSPTTLKKEPWIPQP